MRNILYAIFGWVFKPNWLQTKPKIQIKCILETILQEKLVFIICIIFTRLLLFAVTGMNMNAVPFAITNMPDKKNFGSYLSRSCGQIKIPGREKIKISN